MSKIARSESNGTGWFVSIIVGLALTAIGYLVFSANEGPANAEAAANERAKARAQTIATLTETFNIRKVEVPAEFNELDPGVYEATIRTSEGPRECLVNVTPYNNHSKNVTLDCK